MAESSPWRIHRDAHGHHIVDARGEKLCTVNPRLEPHRQLAIAAFLVAARNGLLEFFEDEPELAEAVRCIAQLDGVDPP